MRWSRWKQTKKKEGEEQRKGAGLIVVDDDYDQLKKKLSGHEFHNKEKEKKVR